MKIVYLYGEMMSYAMATINKLAETGNEIHIIERNELKNKTSVVPTFFKNKIFFYRRLEYNYSQLKDLVKKIDPKVILISGWMDLVYIYLVFFIKNKNITIVVHADSVWKNKPKQQIARLLGFFGFFYLFFDKAWIPGPLQFEYMRRIGFSKKDIFFDPFSADTELFHKLYKDFYNHKKNKYPKKFLFFSRREKIKGIEILLDAWESLNTNNSIDWKLQIIGSGSFKIKKNKLKNLEILEFKSHKNIKKDIKNAGCFILPSIHDPWGVVVHEMCAAGLPLILSETVGSRYTFLIDKKNGFVFEANNYKSLEKAMKDIIDSTDQELLRMSESSHKLSFRVSPETGASNLLSEVNK
jgi:glycosyltransferase involved in cell wall biosynthesis